VHIFLQDWGLDAFRASRTGADRLLAPDAGDQGRAAGERLASAGQASWRETLEQAKAIGQVEIQACSLSMDLLGLAPADLDPLVDGVEGVTAFWLTASVGQVLFI
jgi:peroxiredoxin family protein